MAVKVPEPTILVDADAPGMSRSRGTRSKDSGTALVSLFLFEFLFSPPHKFITIQLYLIYKFAHTKEPG